MYFPLSILQTTITTNANDMIPLNSELSYSISLNIKSLKIIYNALYIFSKHDFLPYSLIIGFRIEN